VIRGDFTKTREGRAIASRAEEKKEEQKQRLEQRNDARARMIQAAESAKSFDERVGHIADLIVAGQYAGRPTAKLLAQTWLVDITAVQNYARSAALVAKADRPAVEAARELSLGQWTRLREEAREADDVKAAVSAQAGWDRAAGVVESGGAKTLVQNTIVQSPQFTAVWSALLAYLRESHPTAVEGAVAAVKGALAASMGPPSVPAGRRGGR
jgi:hypothetical protein